MENQLRSKQKKEAEDLAAKEAFKQQLKKNEMLTKDGNNTMLKKGSEEQSFLKAKKFLQKRMISYFREMEQRGYLTANEKRFLKQGVMFRTLKLAVFDIRQEDLNEKELLIKNGQHAMVGRPSSAQSRRSDHSNYNGGISRKQSVLPNFDLSPRFPKKNMHSTSMQFSQIFEIESINTTRKNNFKQTNKI